MTQLHHISFLFLSLSFSLIFNLPFTFGLSPRATVALPYANPQPIPLESTASQPLIPQSTYAIDSSSNASNTDPYKCFKTSPFAPSRPSYVDCQSAIRRLPEDPVPGSFQYVESLYLVIPNRTPLTKTAPVDLSTNSNYPARKLFSPAA